MVHSPNSPNGYVRELMECRTAVVASLDAANSMLHLCRPELANASLRCHLQLRDLFDDAEQSVQQLGMLARCAAVLPAAKQVEQKADFEASQASVSHAANNSKRVQTSLAQICHDIDEIVLQLRTCPCGPTHDQEELVLQNSSCNAAFIPLSEDAYMISCKGTSNEISPTTTYTDLDPLSPRVSSSSLASLIDSHSESFQGGHIVDDCSPTLSRASSVAPCASHSDRVSADDAQEADQWEATQLSDAARLALTKLAALERLRDAGSALNAFGAAWAEFCCLLHRQLMLGESICRLLAVPHSSSALQCRTEQRLTESAELLARLAAMPNSWGMAPRLCRLS